MTAPLYQEKYDVRLLLSCLTCAGSLVRRVRRYQELREGDVVDRRRASIVCADCGRNYGEESSHSGGFERHTQENVKRGDAPLRAIIGIERGLDGEGMRFELECGHTLRLQRRAYRFSQRHARCIECRAQELMIP